MHAKSAEKSVLVANKGFVFRAVFWQYRSVIYTADLSILLRIRAPVPVYRRGRDISR
jgi:hypothetical protein